MPGTYKKGEQVNIIYKKDDPESFFINKKRVVLFLTFLFINGCVLAIGCIVKFTPDAGA